MKSQVRLLRGPSILHVNNTFLKTLFLLLTVFRTLFMHSVKLYESF